MHIVTTHKGADFDALASIVAANLLYPGIATVLPGSLNPNVRAFLSLHKDLFGFCTSEEIDPDKVDKLTVVDINRWDRLDGLDRLKQNRHLEISLFDHHGNQGDIDASVLSFFRDYARKKRPLRGSCQSQNLNCNCITAIDRKSQITSTT